MGIDKEWVMRLPKVELHLHLSGAYPLDYLEEIASPSDFKQLKKYLDRNPNDIDYHRWFDVFNVIEKIVNTEEKVEEGVVRLCHAMKDDGLVYLEMRTGLKDLGGGLRGYFEAVQRGIARGMAESGLEVRLILSVRRFSSFSVAQETVSIAMEHYGKGVVAMDLSGDSGLGHVDEILPLLVEAKESGLKLCIHMGECQEERDQELIIDMLSPDRIGHGVHLGIEAQEFMLKNKVPLEICLSSSAKARMIPHMRLHPGIAWRRTGHPVCICTDDPLVFQETLTDEYCHLANLEELGEEDLMEVSRKALSVSFLSDEEKEALLQKMEEAYFATSKLMA